MYHLRWIRNRDLSFQPKLVYSHMKRAGNIWVLLVDWGLSVLVATDLLDPTIMGYSIAGLRTV